MEYAQENSFIKESKTSVGRWKLLSEVVDESENSPSGSFDCNICLDSVEDPVVTLCGHLYCWPCIYKWIHHQNTSSEFPNKHNPQCPVCKSDISQKTVVPLYGRGQTTKPHSDEKVPDSMVIPRRPSSPSSGVHNMPTQQLNYSGYQQQAPPPTTMPIVINPISPTTRMFEEMVYGRIFGNTQASLHTYPNSYNLATISTQRARRLTMQADKSLGRICFFLFCCAMMCLILF